MGASVWTQSGPSDLGGSSFFGTTGGGGDCYTQYAAVKIKAAKTAKRGGYLHYRASVRVGKNKTISSINDLRFEVTLPSELSVVASSSSLKRQRITATTGPSSVYWTTFNLTKLHKKKARFGLKLRVADTATSRQVLDITSVLMHERDGGVLCPQFSELQVRAWMSGRAADVDMCMYHETLCERPHSHPSLSHVGSPSMHNRCASSKRDGACVTLPDCEPKGTQCRPATLSSALRDDDDPG